MNINHSCNQWLSRADQHMLYYSQGFLWVYFSDLYDDDEDKNDCGNDNNDCGDDDDNDRISAIS